MLRLRVAYGSTAREPWYTATFDEALLNPVAAHRYLALIQPDETPESTRETEAGADLVMFGERLHTSFTYYNRTTHHVRSIIPRFDGYYDLADIGKVRDRGVEATIGATLLRSRPVTWDVAVVGASNAVKVLGGGRGIHLRVLNQAQLHANVGYPPEPFWGYPITGYSDKNGDGIISRLGCVRPIDGPSAPTCELSFGPEQTYLGSPTPTRTLSIASHVMLFGRATVSAILDHRGGYKRFDLTRQLRCAVARATCRAAQDPTAPQSDQATVAASKMGVVSGYIEDASFWKLREVALTVSAPRRWAHEIAASDLRLTLAGRNLATWTSYRGLDPETADFTQPPVRYLTARLDVIW